MEDARTPKGVKSSSRVHTGSRRDADSVPDTAQGSVLLVHFLI